MKFILIFVGWLSLRLNRLLTHFFLLETWAILIILPTILYCVCNNKNGYSYCTAHVQSLPTILYCIYNNNTWLYTLDDWWLMNDVIWYYGLFHFFMLSITNSTFYMHLLTYMHQYIYKRFQTGSFWKFHFSLPLMFPLLAFASTPK